MLQVVHPINLAIQYSKVVENEKKLDIRPREMLLRVQYGQILTVDREACVHGDQLCTTWRSAVYVGVPIHHWPSLWLVMWFRMQAVSHFDLQVSSYPHH